MLSQSTRGKVTYIPVAMKYYPRAGSNEGDGARRKAAIRFADVISQHLKRLGVPIKSI